MNNLTTLTEVTTPMTRKHPFAFALLGALAAAPFGCGEGDLPVAVPAGAKVSSTATTAAPESAPRVVPHGRSNRAKPSAPGPLPPPPSS